MKTQPAEYAALADRAMMKCDYVVASRYLKLLKEADAHSAKLAAESKVH